MNARSTTAIDFEPLSLESIRPLVESPAAGQCLSLYLPTHRNVPGNSVDRPAYRHLVAALELAITPARPRDEVERLLHPFRVLDGDRHFWQHARDGLAVLAADGRARGFLLQRPVRPLAMATDHFHVLPLVRIVSSLERFTVLTLTSRVAAVYEATAWHDVAGTAAAHDVSVGPLDPLPLARPAGEATAPVMRDEVVDDETHQPHRVFRGQGPRGRADARVIHGGTGSRQDDVDDDTEVFLRHVDALVHDHVSRPTGLPLLVVASGRLAAVFRRLSRNPMLLEERVPLDPHLLSPADLAATIAPVFAAAHARRVAAERAAFDRARVRGLAGDALAEIGHAAVAGRVARLFVEADRFMPGGLDRRTGRIVGDGPPPPDASRTGRVPACRSADVLGDLAETVLLHGGSVVSLAAAAMPGPGGAAAIYRF